MKREKFLKALGGESDQMINLYVTGGGQNSAFTAGMLAAIAAEGWTDSFRYYIGQSSGSFSLMYLLGGVTVEGASGYWRTGARDIMNGRLVNPWRLFNPFRPILDLNYAVDIMFDTDPKIPWEKVLQHPANHEGRLMIQVLDARTGNSFFISRFTTTRALRATIKASSWIPLLAGLRPFYMSKDILAEVTVSDKEGKTVVLEELRTYDGQLANSFFGDTYRSRTEELHMVLTNIARNNRSRFVNPFGIRLMKAERILSWILFWPWPSAIRAYHKSILDGGERRDFDALDAETLDEHTTVLGVFPSKDVSDKSLRDAASMREAVYAGWNGLYAALDLTPARDVSMLG